MKKFYQKPEVKIKSYVQTSRLMDGSYTNNIVYDAGAKSGVKYTLGTLDLNQ